MLRKLVLMPKTYMALTIAASILGQVISSRAERYRLKANAEKKLAPTYTSIPVSDLRVDHAGHCGDTAEWKTVSMEVASSTSSTQHWSTMANMQYTANSLNKMQHASTMANLQASANIQ